MADFPQSVFVYMLLRQQQPNFSSISIRVAYSAPSLPVLRAHSRPSRPANKTTASSFANSPRDSYVCVLAAFSPPQIAPRGVFTRSIPTSGHATSFRPPLLKHHIARNYSGTQRWLYFLSLLIRTHMIWTSHLGYRRFPSMGFIIT